MLELITVNSFRVPANGERVFFAEDGAIRIGRVVGWQAQDARTTDSAGVHLTIGVEYITVDGDPVRSYIDAACVFADAQAAVQHIMEGEE